MISLKGGVHHAKCKMKMIIVTIVSFTLVITFFSNGNCQDSTYQKHSIIGGMYKTVHIINDTPAIMPGIKFGWSFTNNKGHILEISTFVSTLINRVPTQINNYGDTLYLDLQFSGVTVGYSKWQLYSLLFYFQLDLGVGIANQHFGKFDSDLESGYLMYTIRPGFHLSKDLTNNLFVSGGLSYNVIAGSKYFIVPRNKLSGIQLNTRLGFILYI